MLVREALLGRGAIVDDLIPECLARPAGRDGTRDLPVIVVEGPRGAGKTTLLDEVAARYAGSVPTARFDFEAAGTRRARTVVTSLAFQLARKCGQYGRIPFPRLMLGLLVVGTKISRTNRAEALAEIRSLLDHDRGLVALRSVLLSLSNEMVQGGVIPHGSVTGVDVAFDGLTRLLFRRLLRRQGLAGYGPDPYETLVELNWMDREGKGRRTGQVDDRLCRAFLDDLRTAFTQGRRATARTWNCIVLLDNLHAGDDDFLGMLLRQRQEHAGRTRDDCDPMLVLATSRRARGGRSPGLAAPPADRPAAARSPEAATYGDWAATRPRPLTWSSWLYRVQARDLTIEEVTSLALARDLAAVRRVPAFVHRLTHGHPWAVDVLLDALAGMDAERLEEFDLRTILDLPAPAATDGGRAAPTFARAALDYLLRDVPAELRRPLVDGAATANLVDTLGGDGAEWTLPDVPAQLRAAAMEHLWMDGTRSLHPLVRRLLVHHLAARASGTAAGWDEEGRGCERWEDVHRRFRDAHRRRALESQGELARRFEVRALYHDLALGDLRPVVDHLRSAFDRPAEGPAAEMARRWRADLLAITAAPHRPATDRPVRVELTDLEARAAPVSRLDRSLVLLTGALWIATDPLGDPDGDLDPAIAKLSTELRTTAGGHFDFLFDDWRTWHAADS